MQQTIQSLYVEDYLQTQRRTNSSMSPHVRDFRYR